MPWFHEFLTSISRPRAGLRPSHGKRVLAAVLSAMLAFGTVSPGVALASEVDSEGEGSAPSGVIEGGPELEPGAEETVLEELPGAPIGGEESEEGPPLETEPPQESAPAAPGSTGEAAQPPVEEASSTPAQGPEYGPAYEPAPASPASAAVENQPLVAPEGQPSPQSAQHTPEAVQSAPEAPTPVSPPEAPEPQAAQPAATPVQRNGAAGSLAGHRVHTVRAGECLWSIAEALLPAGAGNAEIEAEVQRLWKLNAARIGTGDPSLVYVGTELRLH
jgi:hypothetical protein